jgi:hypothetical protein
MPRIRRVHLDRFCEGSFMARGDKGWFVWHRGEGPTQPEVPSDPHAPVELIANNVPSDGLISARRAGEPTFVWVNSGLDAMMAAQGRGVELHVPAALMDEIRDEFPPDLPAFVRITGGS